MGATGTDARGGPGPRGGAGPVRTTETAGPAGPPADAAERGAGGGAGWRRQARSDPGWLLLPLRLFLGLTFAKAGVDKLTDPAFFDPAEPTSIAGQIAAFRPASPLRPLLGIAADHATAVGVLIAVGEIAVGVATLLGVRVRLAALGGALISLSLLLTVTWQTRPYYYGSDVVFLVSWLPLVGYGSGRVLSLQHAAARRWAQPGAGPSGARRALLAQLGAAGLATLATAIGARLARDAPLGPATAAPTGGPGGPAGTPGSTMAAPTGPALARVADVPVGQVVPVTLPDNTAAYLLHADAGRFVAFSRACPHAGCQIEVTADRSAFACRCHESRFAADTGTVLAGPSPRALDRIAVQVVDGEVRSTG
jgi:thiosulfate dehydrogenase [quinone] large subunit